MTYGAGGNVQANTFELVEYIQEKAGIPSMAHYTCLGSTKDQIAQDLSRISDTGIVNLMALRGDYPKSTPVSFKLKEGSFRYARDLILMAKATGKFCIGCAGYPEKHIEAESFEADLRYLLEKIQAGADFIITQMFFVNDYYFRYIERVRTLGVKCPVIPGIMPITNFRQVHRFSQLCGATIPTELTTQLEKFKDNPISIYQCGVEFATLQCQTLLKNKVSGLHFYTLNKSKATIDILRELNLSSISEPPVSD